MINNRRNHIYAKETSRFVLLSGVKHYTTALLHGAGSGWLNNTSGKVFIIRNAAGRWKDSHPFSGAVFYEVSAWRLPLP